MSKLFRQYLRAERNEILENDNLNFGAKNEENLVDFGVKKSYRCPKFDGDAKQTLEIRVEEEQSNFIVSRIES